MQNGTLDDESSMKCRHCNGFQTVQDPAQGAGQAAAIDGGGDAIARRQVRPDDVQRPRTRAGTHTRSRKTCSRCSEVQWQKSRDEQCNGTRSRNERQ